MKSEDLSNTSNTCSFIPNQVFLNLHLIKEKDYEFLFRLESAGSLNKVIKDFTIESCLWADNITVIPQCTFTWDDHDATSSFVVISVCCLLKKEKKSIIYF